MKKMGKLNLCVIKFSLILTFILINLLVLPNSSFSSVGISHKDLKDLKSEITDKIFTMNEMMNSLNDEEDIINNNLTNVSTTDNKFAAICNKNNQQEMYFLNFMWLRFTAEVSLKVFLVSLRIAPNFGFVWTRANPKDWKNY